MHGRHFEHSQGKGTGLVENDGLHFGKGLEDIGTLDQNPFMTGSANTREERKRDADHKGTGATNHKEYQGPVNPLAPHGVHAWNEHPHQRGEQCKGQGRVAYHRGIYPGETGDESLRMGLVRCTVLHEFQDLGNCRFAELLRRSHTQHAGHVDAPAQHLVAGFHLPGEGLAGEGSRIQGRLPFRHHTVDRHFFAGLHDYYRARLDIVGIHPLERAVFFLDIGIVGTDVHKGGYVPAAPAHRIALEEFPYLIEEHHRDGLQIISALLIQGEGESAQGGHHHQEVLVEDTLASHAQERLPQDIVTYDQIDSQIIQQAFADSSERQHGNIREQGQHGRGHGGHDYADEHLLLFVVHLLDYAEIGFHLPGRTQDLLHDGRLVRSLLKLHLHLLGHEHYPGVLHAGDFLDFRFYQIGAIGAVHFDFKIFFHVFASLIHCKDTAGKIQPGCNYAPAAPRQSGQTPFRMKLAERTR